MKNLFTDCNVYSDVNAYMTYGTDRTNAYKILEDTLNLRDVRIYDTKTDPDGKERRCSTQRNPPSPNRSSRPSRKPFRTGYGRAPERRQQLVAGYN